MSDASKREAVAQVHARLTGRVAEMWHELMSLGYQYSADLVRDMIRVFYPMKFPDKVSKDGSK